MKKGFPVWLFSVCLLPSSICHSQNADINLLHSINSGNSVSWDNTNKFITQTMTPVSIATPVSFFLYGTFSHDSITKRKSYVMGASLAASGLITLGLKYTVNRKRPFVTYPDQVVKKTSAGSYSFPSGHTSSAFATATALSLAYPKWYVIAPSFLWAGAVGYSRMELGVHYPTDVLAGALIGAASSFLMWKADERMAGKK